MELFRGIADRELRRLEQLARRRQYQAGQSILDEGSGAVGPFKILAGNVRITRSAGDEAKEVATMGPDDSFGEMALFRDDARRSATVTAT